MKYKEPKKPATLQVRELPGALYETLKREAQRDHRSLSQEAIMVLYRGLQLNPETQERRRVLLDRLERTPPITNGDHYSNPTNL